MKAASAPPALFTHAARHPEIGEHAKYKRYFGGIKAFFSRINTASLGATVFRNEYENFVHLVVETAISGVGDVRQNANLTADQCRLLACALLDAEHDLRSLHATDDKQGGAA